MLTKQGNWIIDVDAACCRMQCAINKYKAESNYR